MNFDVVAANVDPFKHYVFRACLLLFDVLDRAKLLEEDCATNLARLRADIQLIQSFVKTSVPQ